MIKNKLISTIVAFLTLAFTLSACAQEHRQNENRLKSINAITKNSVLLNNQKNLIPIVGLSDKHFASVNLGFEHQLAFDSLLYKYADVQSMSALKYKDSSTLNDLEDDLKYFNTVIIAITDAMSSNGKYLNFINNIAKNKNVIVALFGDGKSLANLDQLTAPIVWTPQIDQESSMVIPQIIFGGIAAQQTLTIGYSGKYTVGSGYKTTTTRLKYTVPEDAGVNTDDLKEIDEIVKEGITKKAAPGMVVLVAKDGKVIYNKAFGYHTYDNRRADNITDIFDLASVTKVTATTPSVMRLVEQNKLKLDTNVGSYIAKARNTPMNGINVREVMLHQAGFIPYIPFHNFIKEGDYSRDSTAAFPTKVADNYYVKRGFFNDVMWPKMLNSPIKTRGSYVYSDISMYVMQDIVEHITETPEDQYVLANFYKPLGMHTAGYLPRNRFAKDRIVPTEDDKVFRKTLLEGYVHDQGAALKGGVAGHAGLFGSANDLAIFYQLMLNKGTYGGEQYFKPQTVDMFTAKQSNISRRGLGFDRWDPDLTKKYPSSLASPQTFGHTGYTGIAVWTDPTRGLIYVFLSNRVNPTVSEQLGRLNIRPRIQDAIIKAIDKGKKSGN
ncbi:serine hydrolase domain-containing protein [Pedobacter insulae]|uniref:CubicO group peptidase, beta-lactamase class C family n=1 Tax=Pedobacter insulae TaxID=414048 RepID=A0A1I2ZS23_9SPHI|nr:serine hydrolase [Pedobacter insulae]SFH40406.1 CubicO group peptidase, beta-lactamase class C family [Pedobacter insulae]